MSEPFPGVVNILGRQPATDRPFCLVYTEHVMPLNPHLRSLVDQILNATVNMSNEEYLEALEEVASELDGYIEAKREEMG